MSKGKWQKGKITGDQEILSRDEALRILSEQAKNGSVTAAVALGGRFGRSHRRKKTWTMSSPASWAVTGS